MQTTIIPTQNEAWGFWGTMGERAAAAWPIAFRAIADLADVGDDHDAIRAFLDSRHGRHFADTAHDALARGKGLEEAIYTAAATWMGWRTTRRDEREDGIPRGLPYLTAMVIAEGIAADLAA